MHRIPHSIPILCSIALVGVVLLAGCGRLTHQATHQATSASVAIPQGQDMFTPFIQVTRPNVPVTWRNDDGMAHVIKTTPSTSAFLNPDPFAFTVPAHGSATLTFSQPGMYDYYDSTKASWDGDDNRVAADEGVPNFPMAMEGVIWVQGSIKGLSTSASNVIPAGKDDFASDFLAIPVGGSVSWQNSDTDKHTVTQVVGWSGSINPATLTVNVINGTTDAPPSGETKTATFTTPGLYYYYCAAHATVQTKWHRASAMKDASEAPIPMEGFVLVVPAQ
jgi:plastocyanin